MDKPKCVICGGEVDDITELDVPIHVECWLEQDKKLQEKVEKIRLMAKNEK